jgi:hypothetical protein
MGFRPFVVAAAARLRLRLTEAVGRTKKKRLCLLILENSPKNTGAGAGILSFPSTNLRKQSPPRAQVARTSEVNGGARTT